MFQGNDWVRNGNKTNKGNDKAVADADDGAGGDGDNADAPPAKRAMVDRPKLDAKRLLSDSGLKYVRTEFPKVKWACLKKKGAPGSGCCNML